jgi:hypothetical protein
MPITNETWLPSYDELTVPELNLSTPALRAGARYFGKYCDFQSKVVYLRFRQVPNYKFYIDENIQLQELIQVIGLLTLLYIKHVAHAHII